MRGKVAKALRRSVYKTGGGAMVQEHRPYRMIGWNPKIKPNLSAGPMRRLYNQAKKVFQKNGL